MRLWIDCEFNEFRGELISMALVDEDMETFYEVLPCLNPRPWVAEHVIPILFKEPVSMEIFQQTLHRFLSKYDSIHVIADWPEDIKLFCEVLITGPGMRLNTPPLTMEVRRDFDGAISEIPHNALADAISLRAFDMEMAL